MEEYNLDREIESMMAYMSLSVRQAKSPLSIHYFDGAESIARLLSREARESGCSILMHPEAPRADVLDGLTPPEAVEQIWSPEYLQDRVDISIVQSPHEALASEIQFRLFRLKEISTKEARGHAKRIYSRMFRLSGADIRPDGSYYARHIDCIAWVNRHWISCTGSSDCRSGDDSWRGHPALCIAAQGTRHCIWRVEIGWSDQPSVSFSTDPVGVREVFRLRDIPDGKQRRTALRHWVTEHWRQNRDTDGAEAIKVHEHLRGTTSFTWRGLRCRIVTSQLDLERVAPQPKSDSKSDGI